MQEFPAFLVIGKAVFLSLFHLQQVAEKLFLLPATVTLRYALRACRRTKRENSLQRRMNSVHQEKFKVDRQAA